MNKPTVVSLFSGAGGLDLGFKQAGFEILWANDFDKDAVETYRRNISDHVVLGDVSQIHASEIPDADVIIGGFPCQGFSMANTRRSTLDKRNQLYKEYLRILQEKRPKMFLAENVKGILSLGKGEVIKAILKDFESAGYRVEYKLFNTADYGVPQTRQRVIIVGTRADLPDTFSFPEATHAKEPADGKIPWVTVKEAIGHLPDPDGPESHTVPNNVYSGYKMILNGYLGKRPIDANKPAPTITARGDRRGGVVVLPHPDGNRRMTVRELATVQTFPVDFHFWGSKTDSYRQIGNAVPVEFSRHLAGAVLQELGGNS